MRPIIRDHFVIVSQGGQFLGFFDSVIQVTDLINQPVLLRLFGGENAAVRANPSERHFLRFAVAIQKRLTFIIRGWDFFFDDDLLGERAF